MSGREVYSRKELASLKSSIREGAAPRCPRCEEPLTQRMVRGTPGVAYVRNRVWLACPTCGRSAVLDEPRPGGQTEGGTARPVS